jgi:hypothetical protein
VLVLCAPAAAQGPLPPNNGGSTQYIPPRPDPGGDRPANPGSPSRPDRLPAAVRGSLPAGPEGELLTRFATATGYGAPSDEPRNGSGKANGSGGGGGVDGSSSASGRRVLHEGGGTAASAVTSAASDTGVAVLVAALVALTLAGLAVARSRRRSRSG